MNQICYKTEGAYMPLGTFRPGFLFRLPKPGLESHLQLLSRIRNMNRQIHLPAVRLRSSGVLRITETVSGESRI